MDNVPSCLILKLSEFQVSSLADLCSLDTILPIAYKYRVAAINWGFVQGKTQTWYPWDSWTRPYTLEQPSVWHHDIFTPDGKPYRQRELDIIRALTTQANGAPKSGP